MRQNERQPQPVRIEFFDERAQTVAIAGTFNHWDPGSRPMVRIKPAHWMTVLSLPPGRYEYCIVADGRWHVDPAAMESVPNVFGCLNSVLTVPAPTTCRPRRNVASLSPLRRVPARKNRLLEMETERSFA